MTKLDYFALLHQYIAPDSRFYRTYILHVTLVTNKALTLARKLGLTNDQLQFIEEAAMLHDIGVVRVQTRLVDNDSNLPYICHGTQGAEILRSHDLPQHALVAERHTGVGITIQDIREQQLPLPERDYVPVSIEEKIISYADLFFSKHPETVWEEESPAAVRAELEKYGAAKVAIFDAWHQEFSSL